MNAAIKLGTANKILGILMAVLDDEGEDDKTMKSVGSSVGKLSGSTAVNEKRSIPSNGLNGTDTASRGEIYSTRAILGRIDRFEQYSYFTTLR